MREMKGQKRTFLRVIGNWSIGSYETATLKSIELLPREEVLNALQEDYQAMKKMIYGNKSDFEETLEFLQKLQEEIHGLEKSQ